VVSSWEDFKEEEDFEKGREMPPPGPVRIKLRRVWLVIASLLLVVVTVLFGFQGHWIAFGLCAIGIGVALLGFPIRYWDRRRRST
jgi:hypothetical protein